MGRGRAARLDGKVKSSGRNQNRLHRKALRVIGIIGKRQPRDGETDRGMEDEMMGMRVKIIEGMQTCIQSNLEPERKLVVVVVAVIWREGEGKRQKAEGSKNGLASLISECHQTIENGEECRDIETSERSVGPRFQAPIKIEVDRPAMERIEMRMEDLRRQVRGVWSPLTIRIEDIKRPHRK
jgi:hypothetical protein